MTTATEKMPAFCPQCSRKLMVPVSAAGKQGRCPACSHVFMLEAPVAAAVVEPLPDLQPLPDSEPISSNPYGQSSADEYALQPLPQQPGHAASSYAANAYASPTSATATVPNPYAPAPASPEKYSHGFGWEHKGWDAGMIGGLVMMAIALVWFFGGLALGGVIFYYPPILFVIGLVGFFRGLFTGNVSGQ